MVMVSKVLGFIIVCFLCAPVRAEPLVPKAKPEIPGVLELRDAMEALVPNLDKRSLEYRAKRSREFRDIAGATLEAGWFFDVDPVWLVAVAYVESRWVVKTRSGDDKKSHGLWQIQVPTARAAKFGTLSCPQLPKDVSRSDAKLLIREVHSGAHVAAAVWARLRRKYGKRASVIYTCGFRCGKAKSTKVSRAYWRMYRKLKRELKHIYSGCGENEDIENGGDNDGC